ncbi:Peroxisomal membrane signal receptor PTS1 [Gonapodya sp. JEL0774]|nr:Peroxisomal membrane signal receptor PTS1 [Gonapodya sp. JEL0774]
MSLNNLVGGGADCGPVNPLMGLTKRFNEDRSTQQDRFSGPQHAGPSARPGRMGDFKEDMVEEFFNQPQLIGQRPPPGVFKFGDMRSELENVMERQGPGMGIFRGDDWAREFQAGPVPGRMEDPNMMRAFEEHFRGPVGAPPADWQQEFLRQQPAQPMPQDFREFDQIFAQHGGAQSQGPEISEQDWAAQFAQAENVAVEDKGKGKAVEVEPQSWEAEFAQAEGINFGESEDAFMERFNEIWQKHGDAGMVEPKAWEEEFDDYYPGGSGNNDMTGLFDPDPVTAPLQPYTFEPDNPYLNHPDPLAEGLRLWNEGGQLSAAALAFEAAAQKDPNDARAWMLLGQVQAENEKEDPAIAALQRAVKEDNGNLPALMSLAVSYTNEGHDLQAYSTLYRWLSTRYPDIVAATPLPDKASTSLTPQDYHDRITNLFLQSAARSQQVDPDVQVGLGVLFYNAGDYDKAVDCFSSALSARPGDYVLWNRLGATLANSGKSEEAIEAYYKALEIKPAFVRGRYNLGVSCINIGVYKEAAEHLLGALSMHVVGGDGSATTAHQRNISQNLWDTLR